MEQKSFFQALAFKRAHIEFSFFFNQEHDYDTFPSVAIKLPLEGQVQMLYISRLLIFIWID